MIRQDDFFSVASLPGFITDTDCNIYYVKGKAVPLTSEMIDSLLVVIDKTDDIITRTQKEIQHFEETMSLLRNVRGE